MNELRDYSSEDLFLTCNGRVINGSSLSDQWGHYKQMIWWVIVP